MTRTRARALAAVLAVLAVLAAMPACGGSSPGTTTSPASTAGAASTSGSEGTSGATAELPARIVALGEEFLLADLVALGVRPVASTTNAPDGFAGIAPGDTAGIEAIATTDVDLESLAALRPELFVVYQAYLDLGVLTVDDLEAIAPTTVIDDSGDWREQFLATAAAVGLEERAAPILAEVDAAFEAARPVLEGRELSVVSVLPGPLVRAYTDGRTFQTEVLAATGVRFRPGEGTGATDDNGRIQLSLEQLDLLDGEVLLLLQSDAIEGEAEALASLEANPLWQALPAVAAGAVVTLDRLGYPGVEGAGRLVRDLASALEE